MTHVLGITPVRPGFTQWMVRPVLGGGLTWAAGHVPTPSGEIHVRWEVVTSSGIGQQMRLYVSAPANTTGRVIVPVSGAMVSVSLDGRIVYDKLKAMTAEGVQVQDRLVVVPVRGGSHRFLVS